ncbi:MAG: glycosyltransferase family 2 protein [Parafilimonas sp.]|nr:glycosyltransferase family 2 protein [Parafilimonas sp.]
MQPTVTILLAAYNGEKFIAAQIESIIHQTYSNWKLVIRDDCSTDNTKPIIRQYASRFSDKIFLLEDDKKNLGSTGNFNTLMQFAKAAEYIMFCDQDDVWLPGKIEITMSEMLQQQKNHPQLPLLVYTNFIYVDDALQPIASKQNFSATKIQPLHLNHLLAQNPVYGCTMLINKELINKVGEIPVVAENSDYWIALAASIFGKIFYIKKPTVFYRQHEQNISGQHSNDTPGKRISRNLVDKKIFDDVNRKYQMAIQLKDQYNTLLNKQQKNLIDTYVSFLHSKKIIPAFKSLKSGIRRQTFWQTALFYFAVLLRKAPIQS